MGLEPSVLRGGNTLGKMEGLQLLYAGSAFAHSLEICGQSCRQVRNLGRSFKIIGDTSRKFRSFAQRKAILTLNLANVSEVQSSRF